MATNPKMTQQGTATDADDSPTLTNGPGRVAPPRNDPFHGPGSNRPHQPPRGYHPSNYNPQHYHPRGNEGYYGPTRPFTQPLAAGDSYASRHPGRPVIPHLCDETSNQSQGAGRNSRLYGKRSNPQQHNFRDRDLDSIPEFIPSRRFHPQPPPHPYSAQVNFEYLHASSSRHNFECANGMNDTASEYSTQSHHSDSSGQLYVGPDTQQTGTEGQVLVPQPQPQFTVWPVPGQLPNQQTGPVVMPPLPPGYPPVLVGPHYVIIFNSNPPQPGNQPPNLGNLPPSVVYVGQQNQPQQPMPTFDPSAGTYNYENPNPTGEFDYTAIFDPNYGLPPFLTEVGGNVQVPRPYAPEHEQPSSGLPPLGTVYYAQPIHVPHLQQASEHAWTSGEENGTTAGHSESEGTLHHSVTASTSTSSMKLNPKASEFVPKEHQNLLNCHSCETKAVSQAETQTNNSLDKSWSEEMEHHDSHGRGSPSAVPEPVLSSTPIFSSSTYVNPKHPPESPGRRRGGNESAFTPRGRGGYHRGGRWGSYDEEGQYEDQEYGGGYGYRGRGSRGRGNRGRGRGRGRGGFYRGEDYYHADGSYSRQQEYGDRENDGDKGNSSGTSQRRGDSRRPPPGPPTSGPAAVTTAPHVTLPGPFSYATALASGLNPVPARSSSKPQVSKPTNAFPETTTEYVNSAYKSQGLRSVVQMAVWVNSNQTESSTLDSTDFPAIGTSQKQAAAQNSATLIKKGNDGVKIENGDKNSEEEHDSTDKGENQSEDKECGDDKSAVSSADTNNNDLRNKQRSGSDIDAGDGVGIGDSASNVNSGLSIDGAKGEPA